MTLRFRSIAEMPAELRERVPATHPWKAPVTDSPKAAPRPNKYGAKPTYVDGHRFPSKLEAQRYLQLKNFRETGEYFPPLGRLVTFSLWPTFLLPGGVKAQLDSVQVWQNGPRTTVVYEDAKGKDNQASKNKRKQIASIYGIQVQLWPPR
jgi:hypothetical protein